ncbi:MAG: methyltransferase domain-containing protein [Patescibacteria group bacterium]
MSYNNTYQNNPNLWGNRPNNLILMFENDFKPNSNVLDLGCGQGRDALYMAKKGFDVVAVDSSNTAIEQLLEKAKKEQLTNLTAKCADASNFNLQSDKYQIINLYNLLQFIGKDNSIKLINDIKNNLPPNGFVIIKAFTTSDPEYLKNNTAVRTFFEPNELKELFNGFKIRHYIEHVIKDAGHGNKPEPHYHGIVELVAQK